VVDWKRERESKALPEGDSVYLKQRRPVIIGLTIVAGLAAASWVNAQRRTDEIVNVNSGKCLDVPGGSTADGVGVIQFACNGANNQKWNVRRSGEIVNVNSGKCLDVPNGSTDDQVGVNQYSCHGGDNQKWNVRRTGDIVNVNSGKCLDVPDGSTDDRVRVNQYACNGGNNQKWTLR
jgi:hypothetical protein